MRRAELEHVIRAAADVAEDEEIVVVGSQAILGQFPDAPAAMCVSREADVYPRNHPERKDEIDGSLGDGSYFDATYGYFAHAVGPETATGSSPSRRSDTALPTRASCYSGCTACS
jgi:hypothetical protein